MAWTEPAGAGHADAAVFVDRAVAVVVLAVAFGVVAVASARGTVVDRCMVATDPEAVALTDTESALDRHVDVVLIRRPVAVLVDAIAVVVSAGERARNASIALRTVVADAFAGGEALAETTFGRRGHVALVGLAVAVVVEAVAVVVLPGGFTGGALDLDAARDTLLDDFSETNSDSAGDRVTCEVVIGGAIAVIVDVVAALGA